MPRRIILHAGFHKTGTTTVQATLRKNRAALKRQVAMRLAPQMKDLIHATRGYSTWRDPLTLIKVQDRFKRLLDDLPGMPRRTLIISAEELSGHLPGRGDLADYSAAPVLMYAFRELAHEAFPAAEILLYFGTRRADAWLESAYWEHVKASSLTLDFDAFATRYRGAANLDAMVAEIASRVPAPMHHCALEDCTDGPLGPADPLLDLCDLPADVRASLVPAAPANTQLAPDVLAALLDANRRHSDPKARSAAKYAILGKTA